MSIPEGLTAVPVAGVIAGSPRMPGDALFECNIWNQNPSTGRIVPPFGVRAPIYASGAISVDLPPTDDPTYEQVGWQYTVTLRWGTHIIQGALAVPRATAGVLNLAAALVLHQPADPGLVDYLTAADKGIPGGVASLDPATGKVPALQLPSGSGGGGVLTWAELEGKPATFPPSAHGHPIADVAGLQTALDGKQPAGSYAAASHGHAIAQISGLQSALDGKQAAGSYAAAAHGHTVADVAGLQAALDGKQAAGSYAAASVVTDLADRLLAVENEPAPTWENLPGKPATFPASPHGHTITDVAGLQTALDGKQPAGSYAAASHGHTIAQISGLQSALDGKQPAGSYATAGDLTAVAARVTAVEDMTPLVLLWTGLAYVEAPLGRLYVGPVDPGAVADGSVWIDTTP